MNNPHNLTLELASPKGIYLDIIPEGQQFPPPPPPPLSTYRNEIHT